MKPPTRDNYQNAAVTVSKGDKKESTNLALFWTFLFFLRLTHVDKIQLARADS